MSNKLYKIFNKSFCIGYRAIRHKNELVVGFWWNKKIDGQFVAMRNRDTGAFAKLFYGSKSSVINMQENTSTSKPHIS